LTRPLYVRLLQNPLFYLDMPFTQQVKRAAAVMALRWAMLGSCSLPDSAVALEHTHCEGFQFDSAQRHQNIKSLALDRLLSFPASGILAGQAGKTKGFTAVAQGQACAQAQRRGEKQRRENQVFSALPLRPRTCAQAWPWATAVRFLKICSKIVKS
jgi:hypothetical protein